MKKLSILVSTVDDALKRNPGFFEHIDFDICEVIVIQQMIKNNEPLKLDNPTKVFSYKEKGLSKSRNRAIEKATCEIALIADDDVSFVKGFEQIILEAYENQSDADIITFQVKSTAGGLFKQYSNKAYKHSFRTVLKISSIEISFKTSAFKQQKLFDEKFGLGSDCPGGEETIFVLDAVKAGHPMYYVPKPIVVHPPVSSGRVYTEQNTFERGIIYRRAFGWMSPVFILAFALKKHNEYKDKLGFFNFIKLMWKGNLVKQ